MADAFTDPPPPRIRATTPNPSRTLADEHQDSQPTVDESVATIMALYAWAEEHDPQPAWWRRRARREWRHKWGVTP